MTFKNETRFLCAPWCLLYVKSDKKLYPIAIQLFQKGGPDVPIYTPADSNIGQGMDFSDWLIAKMWVKVADINQHQMAVHLMGTHLLMEPISMAVMRNLPSRHPIYKACKISRL